jgi:putative DNA primase/helicase
MMVHEIAHYLKLKPIRGGYHGACPVCAYPTGFSLREKDGKTLAYCHVGNCSWEAIRRALQAYGLFPEKQNARAAIVTTVATVKPRLDSGCYSFCNSRYSKPLIWFHLELWSKSQPAQGTVVETYLRSRGIILPIPGTIRFLPRAFHKPSGQHFPVMLARVDLVGQSQPVAVHRTFLKPDGSGKADVPSSKMMLGPVQGGSVHLAEPTDILAVTEGIETGLSVMQATGLSTWAALSCVGMRSLVLPPGIKTVWIFSDNDNSNQRDNPGLKTAYTAAEHWTKEGRNVRVIVPSKPGQDFNDLLRMEASQ